MKVRVDDAKCQGHARCVLIVPQLFEADDFGYGHARGDGEVPDDMLGYARQAVLNCPEHAVELHEA